MATIINNVVDATAIGSSDTIALFSPIIEKFNIQYTGDAPSYVNIYYRFFDQNNSEKIIALRANPLTINGYSATPIYKYFYVDVSILKGFCIAIPSFKYMDWNRTTMGISVQRYWKDADNNQYNLYYQLYIPSSRQYGQSEKVETFKNDQQVIYAFDGDTVPVSFNAPYLCCVGNGFVKINGVTQTFSSPPFDTNNISFTSIVASLGNTSIEVKRKNNGSFQSTYTTYIKLVVMPKCKNDYKVWFVDSLGMTRYWRFYNYAKSNYTTKNLGYTNEFTESLQYGQPFRSLGNTTTKQIVLSAGNVDIDVAEILSDINKNEMVWMEEGGIKIPMKVKSSNIQILNGKNSNMPYVLTLEYPEINTYKL